MKLIAGKVFSIAEDCKPNEGCTVSREVEGGENAIVIFSLDRKTDISPEIFSEHKFLLLHEGDLQVYQKEEGKATINYEGKDHLIQAGEQFHFAKGGRHSVKAEGRFKMALLLTLE